MEDGLMQALKGAGQRVATLGAPGEARIVAMEYGGRVLGLFAPHDAHNFFWVNPRLDDPESARAFLASPGWHSSGGCRTWLSPELSFFYPGYPDLSRYVVPPELDPGSYALTADNISLTLRMQGHIPVYAARGHLEVTITKCVSRASNPLRHLRGFDLPDSVQFAGCAVHTTLELAGDAPLPVSLWSILQLPHGGEALAPAFGRAEPMAYFGGWPDGALRVEEGLVRCRMDADGIAKFGIHAARCAGRLGYRYSLGDRDALLVWSFTVDPSGDYLDAPPGDQQAFGCAAQICSVRTPELGAFTELEYHSPAIGGPSRQRNCTDTSHIWAFTGTSEALNGISQALLGVRTPQASSLE